MLSEQIRKLRGLPQDVIQAGIAIFWGFGILGAFIYLLEFFSFIRGLGLRNEFGGSSDITSIVQGLFTTNNFTGLSIKGLSPLDLCFLFALGLNYLYSSKHRFKKTASLLAGLCAGLIIKDVLVLLAAGIGVIVLLSFLFSLAGVYVTFHYFSPFKKDTTMLEKKLPETDYGSSPLQVDQDGKLFIPSKTCEYHIQVCGGTGAGKSFRVIKPFIRQDIIINLIGCLIFDVKSNMAELIAYYAFLAHRVEDFLFFDIGNLVKSMTWNPLYWGTPDQIANRVFSALYFDRHRENQHYSDLAGAFIKNLVFLLKLEMPVITFQDLLDATTELDSFKTIQRLCQKYPKDQHSKYFASVWLPTPLSTRRTELIGLIDKLQRFCNSEWSSLINTRTPEIVLKDVIENNKIILFGIARSKFPADAKPLAVLALMELDQMASERQKKRPEKTFRIYMDEFYHLIYNEFIGTLNLAREARFSFVLAHQSLSDLSMISPDFLDQFDINTRTKIVLTQDNSKTAKYFSELMGTEVDEDRKIFSFDTRSGIGATPAGYTNAPVHEFRINPNVLKELPEGEAVVRTVFPTGPVLKKAILQKAPNPPKDFNLNHYLKDRNHHLKAQDQAAPEERLDLLKERTKQEPEDPRIKSLDEKYSKGRKILKRD